MSDVTFTLEKKVAIVVGAANGCTIGKALGGGEHRPRDSRGIDPLMRHPRRSAPPREPRPVRRIKHGPTGNRWPSHRVQKARFVEMLGAGMRHADIARAFGVTQPLITRLVNFLGHDDLVQIARTRPPAYVPPVKITTIRPVDLVGEVIAVLDEIHAVKTFLDSAEGATAIRQASTRLNLKIQLMDRQLRWVETFLRLRTQMAEWNGFAAWQKDFLALLEEEAPELKRRLQERIAAKVLMSTHRPSMTVATGAVSTGNASRNGTVAQTAPITNQQRP